MPGFACSPWLCQRAILPLCFPKLSCFQGSFLIKPLNAAVCLEASRALGFGDVNVHPFGEQEFAPAGICSQKRLAEKFVKVDCEGRQLEVGVHKGGSWRNPCVL